VKEAVNSSPNRRPESSPRFPQAISSQPSATESSPP
jgi:hypothetical protein